MRLQEAWNLIESLNNTANLKVDSEVNNDQQSILNQSQCFRDLFLELDDDDQFAINQWLNEDAEFYDYFACLSNNMNINIVGKR